MNTLVDVFPTRELEGLFGSKLRTEILLEDQLSKIAKLKSAAVFAIGGSVWNRIVSLRGQQVVPDRFGHQFSKNDPKVHVAIAKFLGEEVIRGICYAKAWNGVQKKENLAMEFLLAEVYPGELHLADVLIQNPDQPIRPIDRQYTHQTHKGLGLFPTVLANMDSYAKTKGIRVITLTAANADLLPFFTAHGFVVERSPAAVIGMKFGLSIPMERAVPA